MHFWSDFGGLGTPGKIQHCYRFSPSVDNGSYGDSLDSQRCRNGFVTLSWLIYVNEFSLNSVFQNMWLLMVNSWIQEGVGGSFFHIGQVDLNAFFFLKEISSWKLTFVFTEYLFDIKFCLMIWNM